MFIRILVLEDDDTDWLMLEELFQDERLSAHCSFELARVASLAAARLRLQESEFHLLIVGYYLPDGSPPEFLNEALVRHPHLRVLLVSGDAQLVTRLEVGELLQVPRVSFYAKSDLQVESLQHELKNCTAHTRRSESGADKKRKILLVDDDPEELQVLASHCDKIDEAQLEIDWAPNSRTALDKISNMQYDLILVDYRLTGEVGTDVIESLHQAGVTATIMLIAGSASFFGSREALRCLGHQRAGFISKQCMDDDRLRQVLNLQTET